MNLRRIALANLAIPSNPQESLAAAGRAIAEAAATRILAFPEFLVAGYRGLGYQPYGKAGPLLAEIDLDEATGLLASRCISI